jgi:hypothetical protein
MGAIGHVDAILKERAYESTLHFVEAGLGVTDALDSGDAGTIQTANRAQTGVDAGGPVVP